MLHEFTSNVRPDLDGDSSADLSCGSPHSPLPGAVIDKVGYPSLMQTHDGPPEESPIGADVAGPLIRKALFHTRKSKCIWPNLSQCQLRPIRNIDILWDFCLKLHDLLLG